VSEVAAEKEKERKREREEEKECVAERVKIVHACT